MEDAETSPQTPFLYANHIYKMLDNALDYGISEEAFWSMTFAELDRLVASKKRVSKFEAKEKATHNYLLAIMIGRAFASSMDNKATFPEIHEIYPTLFNKQEQELKKQEKINQLSALRFKQFAQSYNKRFKEVANDNGRIENNNQGSH